MIEDTREAISRAAAAIAEAEAMLITAGAGMGVDSGLPDFRGNQGFWEAYPPLKDLGISFVEMANPGWFERDPTLAWGFYGHRLNLYRNTNPHDGFALLRSWGQTKARGCFVFTSNVDGHFQRSGFDDDQVLECHGSIEHLQCVRPCCQKIWPAESLEVAVDPETFRAAEPLPSCPGCGAVARPNVLMFGDWSWIANRSHAQEGFFESWNHTTRSSRRVVVELGAGTAVPTVRYTSENAARQPQTTLIRINVREAHGPSGHIGIAAGALEAVRAIDELVATV